MASESEAQRVILKPGASLIGVLSRAIFAFSAKLSWSSTITWYVSFSNLFIQE